MKEPVAAIFVLDAGALIALERADGFMLELLRRVSQGHARLILPDSVLAQVWRGGSGRQARVATLLALRPDKCLRVALDTEAAKRIGVQIAVSGHADVVDVQVAVLAQRHGGAVITSDRKDLLAVDPTLRDRIVEI